MLLCKLVLNWRTRRYESWASSLQNENTHIFTLNLLTKQTLQPFWNEILTCDYKMKTIEGKGNLNFTFYIGVEKELE